MPLTVPTAAGQRQAINGQDYISVADGDRLVLVKVAPEPINLAPLEKKITDLATNEAADDKTVEALDALVKAIDLKPLGDRVTALENNPVSIDEIVISELPPSDGLWKYWSQIIYDWDKWLVSEVQYVQVRKGWALERSKAEPRPMPPASHENAREVSSGVFESRVQGGAALQYKTTRTTTDVDSLTFPAGVYSNIGYHILDANKTEINGLNGGGIVAPSATTWGQGFSSLPPEAKWIRYRLTRASGAIVEYSYPLV
jgi:hypothetical protein